MWGWEVGEEDDHLQTMERKEEKKAMLQGEWVTNNGPLFPYDTKENFR